MSLNFKISSLLLTIAAELQYVGRYPNWLKLHVGASAYSSSKLFE